MATGSFTRGAALAVEGERGHTTAHERGSLSSRAEAVGRELARPTCLGETLGLYGRYLLRSHQSDDYSL